MNCKSLLFIKMNKRGAGMVVPIIIGIAFLITTTIIAFVVVSNVLTVEQSTAGYQTLGVTNETGWVNKTGYTVKASTVTGFSNPKLVALWNITSGLPINLANATISSSGLIKNSTATGADVNWDLVYISYQYDSKVTSTTGEGMVSNLSTGVGNVANKIPTILLIVAVVIILGVLGLLWQQYKKMSGGEGGGL